MLEPLDYETVGLICAPEVHRPLPTGVELVCRCPAGPGAETHDGSPILEGGAPEVDALVRKHGS